MRRAWFIAVLVLGGVPLSAFGQEWTHAGGTQSGSNAGGGQGGISADPERLPGVSWAAGLPATDFAPSAFADVDGDGVAEMLRAFQGRLGAFDVSTGALRWASAALGIDAVVGVFDTDGDGSAAEVVTSASGMGGGVRIIDLATGAVLLSSSGLPAASGVEAAEVTVVDFDGDGADEVIFALSLFGLNELYLLDPSAEGGDPALLEVALRGVYAISRIVVGDFDGDGVSDEIAVFQGYEIDFKELCDAADSAANCAGALCVCDREMPVSPWNGEWVLGADARVGDADGDGDDEILTVHGSPFGSDAFGVVDPGSFFDGSGSPELTGWLYDSTAVGPDSVRPLLVGGTPTELIPGAGLNLVATVFGASTGEVGLGGLSDDDGLDHPSGFSVGVYDAADGGLVASLEDAYAHEVRDVNGNGIPEIIVESTDGWLFTGGGVEGWELGCDDDVCALVQVWSAPALRVTRHPTVFDDAAFPPRSAPALDPDGDGVLSLFLFDAGGAVVATWDGATGLQIDASLALGAEREIVGLDTDLVVVRDADGDVTTYDGALLQIAQLNNLPSSERPRWYAAYLDLDATRATPLLAGHAFISEPSPTGLGDADLRLAEHIALIADVDSDGFADVFGWNESQEEGAQIFSRWEFASTGVFEERWQWSTVAPTDLRPLAALSEWQFAAGDLTGDGVEDFVLGLHRGNAQALVTLDGVTGREGSIATLAGRDAYQNPMYIGDVTDGETLGQTDGVVDLVRPNRPTIGIFEAGATEPVHDLLLDVRQTHNLFADLDGDGADEIVVARLGRVADPWLSAMSMTDGFTTSWAQPTEALDLAPNIEQAMTSLDLDGVPGKDLLIASAAGGVDGRSGLDGTRLDGFLLYFGAGKGSGVPVVPAEPVTALISADLDGDGLSEAIVATSAGWVYTLDVAAAEEEQGVAWSIFLGTVVHNLATADVDGDGEIEVLLTGGDGVGRVLDGLGVALEITSPSEEDCIAGAQVSVCGTSRLLERIDLYVQGVEQDAGIVPAADGLWCGTVQVPLVKGLIEIKAIGLVGTQAAIAAQLLVESQTDQDADGVTVCGGDCEDEDPGVAPGLPELCNGFDDDCDPTTDEEVDSDGDGISICDGDCDDAAPDVSPDADEACDNGIDDDCDGLVDGADGDDCAPAADDDDDSGPGSPGGGCGACADGCSAGGSGAGGVPLLLLGAAVGFRRRQR